MSNNSDDEAFSAIFAVICIIGYIIYKAFIPILVIAIVGILTWAICKFVKAKKEAKRIKLAKIDFYKKLCDKYSHIDSALNDDIDTKISNLLWLQIFSRNELNDNLKDHYTNLYRVINDSFEKCSIWNCNNFNPSNNSYDRVSASVNMNLFMKLDKFGEIPSFNILGDNLEICIFPHICIVKEGIRYDIVDIMDITINDLGSVIIAETNDGHIRGASPIRYEYQYSRVDGGPDRRYKYNPATPIYRYESLEFVCGKSLRFLIANEQLAFNIIQAFSDYKEAYQKYLINAQYGVQFCDVSKDEYASLIRQLLAENGKEFIKSKRFIALLSDYRVFKNKPHLRAIFNALTNHSLWDRILDAECSYNSLNQLKDHAVNANICANPEATEAFAYIAYGLEIKS